MEEQYDGVYTSNGRYIRGIRPMYFVPVPFEPELYCPLGPFDNNLPSNILSLPDESPLVLPDLSYLVLQ